jgi:hypothetical protein
LGISWSAFFLFMIETLIETSQHSQLAAAACAPGCPTPVPAPHKTIFTLRDHEAVGEGATVRRVRAVLPLDVQARVHHRALELDVRVCPQVYACFLPVQWAQSSAVTLRAQLP